MFILEVYISLAPHKLHYPPMPMYSTHITRVFAQLNSCQVYIECNNVIPVFIPIAAALRELDQVVWPRSQVECDRSSRTKPWQKTALA